MKNTPENYTNSPSQLEFRPNQHMAKHRLSALEETAKTTCGPLMKLNAYCALQPYLVWKMMEKYEYILQ